MKRSLGIRIRTLTYSTIGFYMVACNVERFMKPIKQVTCIHFFKEERNKYMGIFALLIFIDFAEYIPIFFII